MGLRKFINELLVVSPFLLVGGLTVQARTRVENYVPDQYSIQLNRKIMAYSEPVRLVETALAEGISHVDAVQVRKIAETWRNMSHDGALQPLMPETRDDSTRDGIKSQIRKAADDLASALQYVAKKEIRNGRYFAAANDAILSVEAIQGFKYSDLYSVGMLSVRQNGAFMIVQSVAPKLNAQERAALTRRLMAVRQNEKPLAELVLARQRVTIQGESQNPLLGVSATQLDLMIQLATAIDRNDSAESMAPMVDELKRLAVSSSGDSFLPEFRFAFNARRNNSKLWDTLKNAYNVPNA